MGGGILDTARLSSLRSSVFDRMLDSGMSEATEGRIRVDDLEPEVLAKVLEYLDTDKVNNLGNLTVELLYAGDKYELKGLVKLCACQFQTHITPSNAADILLLADRHQLDDLKQNVMMKIVNDKATFLNNEEFIKKMVASPERLLELFKL